MPPRIRTYSRSITHSVGVAGESGQVSVFKVQGKTVSPLATAWFGPNAHVVAVDSATHEAFFPLKPAHGKPMLRITRPNTEM